MLKRTLAILLGLLLVASSFAIMPAIAKNLNIPDATRMLYIDGGGTATISLPTVLTGYPGGAWPQVPGGPTAPYMKLSFIHINIPNTKMEDSGVLVYFYCTTAANTALHWEPFAYFTTEASAESYLETFWDGTFVKFPGTHYNPAWPNTDNVKVLSDDVLKIDRHGNSVSLNFAAPQTITKPNGVTFTLPAFSLELKGYGEATFVSEHIRMGPWYLASEYIMDVNNMGFSANGAFSCTTWSYSNHETSNGFVTMHGTQYVYAP